MSGPVYKCWRMRSAEAWYQLSQIERDALLAKVLAALDEVGGKSVVMCDSRWAEEEWGYWGVEEFPDVQAVQRHTQLLHDLNWFRYIESESMLGTKYPE